ncbi:MAG: ABC transporter permease [Coriobacteriia bacterium]|nr:ABC transporter permease [Coriobacteriia bacterium]
MFFRMIKGVLLRQKGKMFMIAFTIALGASLATAMLAVMFDVGDKVNQELKTYGANITVVAKEASVVDSLYEVDGASSIPTSYLKEADVGNVKKIFWAFNIVDFAPFIETHVSVDGKDVIMVGSWFNHHLSLDTGEELDAGVVSMRSWWTIEDGAWLDESQEADAKKIMLGTTFAQELGVKAGDTVKVSCGKNSGTYEVAGVYNAGSDEDNEIFAPLDLVQELSGTDGLITSIEVSAITTPDNELSRQAAKDPGKLTVAEYETWYCTAYVSSICYQLQEAIPDAVAKAVRQVAESEGAILDKTQLLMVLITILALIGSALGISNLITASVMERSQEIGLLKAIGAHDRAISGLLLVEMIIVAILGGAVGFGVGYGFAQVIGYTVFNSSINLSPMVIPLVVTLVILVTLAGSIPAIRTVLRLDPAEVLHGR